MSSKAIRPSIMLIICLVGFPQISETIYTPALPNIAHSLMTSNAMVQWTLSIYFFGFALGVWLWGSLSDRFGRKPMMLLGISVYGLASLACLLSTSICALLIFRFAQAIGASVGSVITQAIVREVFSEEERHEIFILFGIILSACPALGPIIGGYVNQYFQWQANFAILCILSIMIFFYAWLRLPETRWTHAVAGKKQSTWSLICSMFTNRHVLLSSILVATINGVLFGFFAEAPFVFIKQLHLTVSHYGWLGIFIGGATMLGSIISRKLHKCMNGITIGKLGLTLAITATLLMLLIMQMQWVHTHNLKLLAVISIMGLFAIIMVGINSFMLPRVLSNALLDYRHCLGKAGSWFGLSYYVLLSGFIGLIGLMHNGTLLTLPIFILILVLISSLCFILLNRKSS